MEETRLLKTQAVQTQLELGAVATTATTPILIPNGPSLPEENWMTPAVNQELEQHSSPPIDLQIQVGN